MKSGRLFSRQRLLIMENPWILWRANFIFKQSLLSYMSNWESTVEHTSRLYLPAEARQVFILIIYRYEQNWYTLNYNDTLGLST